MQSKIPSIHSTQDTFTFIKELEEVRDSNNFLVSFDVSSFFTKLFQFATSEAHFYFNGEIYEQVDGVAMGSPLAPVLANLFMGHHEQHWLIQKEALSVLFYKRYVDDIFCIFKTSEQADKFLDFSNTRHKNIKFTI